MPPCQIVLAQIRAFSVQMRGGSLRYQAQVLRKIRVPAYATIPVNIAKQLAAAASQSDQATLDELATIAYRI